MTMRITAIFETKMEAVAMHKRFNGIINVWDDSRYDVGPHGKATVRVNYHRCSFGKWSVTFKTGNALAAQEISEACECDAVKVYNAA